MSLKMNNGRQRGLTFIEFLIVLTIIMILVVLLLPAITGAIGFVMIYAFRLVMTLMVIIVAGIVCYLAIRRRT